MLNLAISSCDCLHRCSERALNQFPDASQPSIELLVVLMLLNTWPLLRSEESSLSRLAGGWAANLGAAAAGVAGTAGGSIRVLASGRGGSNAICRGEGPCAGDHMLEEADIL